MPILDKNKPTRIGLPTLFGYLVIFGKIITLLQ
jgi:hypothetical protein